ncbi:MAG TPA: hypothetical protein PLZ36_04275 [Armatimonadota bacterium]|nr:hypothetical protein [Armatimonadota bacterium]HOS43607.1 hypothetical protein [Armatimonadota bacterium]
MITAADRALLRDLARRVADIADQPMQAARRARWTAHNSLRSTEPMILVFPEGAWQELLPPSALTCTDDRTRGMEWQLRARLYAFAHFQDDAVITKEWTVGKTVRTTGWGLEVKRKPSTEARGAFHFDPVILEPGDLQKLRFPEVIYDEAASEQSLREMQELFGDILEVRQTGIAHISFHLMSLYTGLRGLEEVMVDMYAEPTMLHDAMAFLEEGHHRLVRQYIDLNLLSLNNDNTYHSSGGNGYTDELPAPGYDGAHVRPCDMWASAEAQELAQVSPEQHAEFVLPYEKRLLAPFALNGYGCCEDLTKKLDDVLTIPHIRRISISPWADVDACAERLRGDVIFSWKPHPSHLVNDFDPDFVRGYLRHTIEVCQAHGCVLEMILKDTHTCEFHPERFDQWTQIAREEAERAGAAPARL